MRQNGRDPVAADHQVNPSDLMLSL